MPLEAVPLGRLEELGAVALDQRERLEAEQLGRGFEQ